MKNFLTNYWAAEKVLTSFNDQDDFIDHTAWKIDNSKDYCNIIKTQELIENVHLNFAVGKEILSLNYLNSFLKTFENKPMFIGFTKKRWRSNKLCCNTLKPQRKFQKKGT